MAVEKIPEKKLINLLDKISNYLKFISFIKSCSPLTRRSYQLDLAQAFNVKKSQWTKGWSPTRPHLATLEGDALAPSKESIDENQLLLLCRQALNSWGHLEPASRNRKAATLQSFLGWLYQEGLTHQNLAERIHSPRVPKKLPRHLSVDEVMAVLATFKSHPHHAEECLFILLYGCGLRISEACHIQWSHFENQYSQLRVTGKGKQQRIVPLPDQAKTCIQKFYSQQNGPYLFGKAPLGTRQAFAIIRKRGELAHLLHPLNPHALRHSYATHLLGGGANLRHLQELLGHKSLRATEKYTHLGLDQLARTMEKSHPRTGSTNARGARRSRS